MSKRDYRRYTDADMQAVMQEAFMIGRIYAKNGEKESPREIQVKLGLSCGAAIVRMRQFRRKHRSDNG